MGADLEHDLEDVWPEERNISSCERWRKRCSREQRESRANSRDTGRGSQLWQSVQGGEIAKGTHYTRKQRSTAGRRKQSYSGCLILINQMNRSLRRRPAPGNDQIHCCMIKSLNKKSKDILLALCNTAWEKKYLPCQWKGAVVVSICKPNKDGPIALTSLLNGKGEEI